MAPDAGNDAAQAPAEAANEMQPQAVSAAASEASAAISTAPISRANPRKVREGVVTAAGMDKTAVVTIIERVRHRLYGKTVQRSKRLYVHDEQNECREGDRVRVQETRPLSKLKRWRLVEIVERAR
jgi:small subunit ribosomal protein S17